jgi:release factor glutamine methyltransferase
MRKEFCISSLLQEGSHILAATSPSPQLDAELILAHLLGCSRLTVVIEGSRQVESDIADSFAELIARRARHEPVAYLTGRKEFWGLDFEVSPAVLIPRPDTEVLVEEAIRLISSYYRRNTVCEPCRVIDLGTGSGCISVAISHECQERGIPIVMLAVDRSCVALEIAKRNANRHGVGVSFFAMSWVSAFRNSPDFDLIISNPPYIDRSDTCRSPETDYEPSQALFAEEEGLSDIRDILQKCPKMLREGGSILCEVGSKQAPIIGASWVPTDFSFRSIADLSGIERVVALTRRVGMDSSL